MKRLFDTVAQWWRNRSIARANLARLRNYEVAVVQPIVHALGAAPPELHALAGKWPDAALKRRLAVLALDSNDSRSM